MRIQRLEMPAKVSNIILTKCIQQTRTNLKHLYTYILLYFYLGAENDLEENPTTTLTPPKS